MISDLIGKTLGRYHILEQLGEGGMATVYKASDTALERIVAVKVILPGQQHSEKFLQRFHLEAKALASLSHPNIVKVLDFGEQDKLTYLVMEFISGGTLKTRLGSPISYQEASRLLSPIARALEYAHHEGIIHRDVKPANILIDEHGQPMLSDFGVAKVLESEETLDLTGTGVGIGTPDYMAPEQGFARGVDGRSDIYSLGVVFYEMITGRKPYHADTPMAVLLMKATEPMPRPSKFVAGLPEAVEYTLIKSLDRLPEHRYQSMGAFAEVLEGLALGKKIPTGKIITSKRVPVRRGFSKWIVSASIIGALLAGFALIVLLFPLIKHLTAPTARPSPTIVATVTILPEPEASPTAVASETPWPTSTVQSKNVSEFDGMTLVNVPAGEFLIGMTQAEQDLIFSMCPGCPRDLFQDAPQRSIYLDGFSIDQTEVTISQFSKFVSATNYVTTAEKNGSSLRFLPNSNTFQKTSGVNWRNPQGPELDLGQYGQYPVTQVSWNDATAYCNWAHRRLPSEFEWEKAARGTEGFIFPWGNTSPNSQYSNYDRNLGEPTAVGSYPLGASPYGAYDMAGNVWEWTGSYYSGDYYNQMPSKNPPGPTSGDFGGNRELRGGSWGTFEVEELAYLSSAYRLSDPPAYSSDLLGFRCAMSW